MSEEGHLDYLASSGRRAGESESGSAKVLSLGIECPGPHHGTCVHRLTTSLDEFNTDFKMRNQGE
jgi:hypothetical protein